MSLLVQDSVYKPFRYPWAYDAWLKQQQIHWLPEEVPLLGAADLKTGCAFGRLHGFILRDNTNPRGLAEGNAWAPQSLGCRPGGPERSRVSSESLFRDPASRRCRCAPGSPPRARRGPVPRRDCRC